MDIRRGGSEVTKSTVFVIGPFFPFLRILFMRLNDLYGISLGHNYYDINGLVVLIMSDQPPSPSSPSPPHASNNNIPPTQLITDLSSSFSTFTPTHTPTTKRGAKKGGTRLDLPHSFWYELCERFSSTDNKHKSQVAFLRSDESGIVVTEKHQMCFSRALNKYKEGSLQNKSVKRSRTRKWAQEEDKLLDYLSLRHQLKQFNDPTQVTLVEVRDIVASWDTTSKDFVVTAGWIQQVMKKFNDFHPTPGTATPITNSNSRKSSNKHCRADTLDVGPTTIISQAHAMTVLQQVKQYCETRGMPPPIVGLADALMHQIEALPGVKKRGRPLGVLGNRMKQGKSCTEVGDNDNNNEGDVTMGDHTNKII